MYEFSLAVKYGWSQRGISRARLETPNYTLQVLMFFSEFPKVILYKSLPYSVSNFSFHELRRLLPTTFPDNSQQWFIFLFIFLLFDW